MEWFEEFDFYENPFSTEPDKFLKQLVGVETLLDDLFYRVDSGSMVFVEGAEGIGKTVVLKRVIGKFKGKKRVIYFDCKDVNSNADIQELMHKRYGFFGKLLKLTPKNIILLLDNAVLSLKNTEKIKFYFDEGYINAVIFTGKTYNGAQLPQSVRNRIGGRIIKLKVMTPEEAVELVRRRAGDSFFTDEIIKKIYKRSGNNIKKFLENCEKVARKAVSEKKELADDSDLKAIGDKSD